MPSRTFALCLAAIVLIGPLAIHLFLPAIPAVKAEFGISDGLAQLTFTSGVLALAVSTLVYGTLADRFGRRPVLLSGLATFLAGSAISAAAVSLEMLLVGRLVQSVGAGCATTLVRTIARDAYGQQHLAKAIAYLTMFYTLGPMISPLMGGLLIDAFGWRAIFLFALALGAAIAIGAVVVVQETHTSPRARLEPAAVVRGWIEPFRNPRFAAFVLQTGFSTGGFLTLTTAAAMIMREQLGRPATDFGLYFLVFPIGFLLGNVISSRLVGRVSTEALVLAGSALMMGAAAVQGAFLLAGVVTPFTLFAPGLLLTMAQGIALPSAQAGAMALMPANAGTAAGLGVFVQMMIGAIVSQVYGIFASGSAVPLVTVSLLSAGLVLVCGVIPYRMARRGLA